MRRGHEEMCDEIFFFGIKVHHSYSTTLLAFVFIWIGALDISAGSKHKRVLFFSNQIFYRKYLGSTLDHSRASFITIFIFYLFQFVFDYPEDFLRRSKNGFEILNQ